MRHDSSRPRTPRRHRFPHRRTRTLLACAALWLAACLTVGAFMPAPWALASERPDTAPDAAVSAASEEIAALLTKAAGPGGPLARAHVGLYVQRLDDGAVLAAHNERRLFIPASAIKLVTTAAAFELLGPEYVYTTPLFMRGEVVDGVLRGDLLVRGAGDPSLGGALSRDPLGVFRQWAQALQARGVTRVAGDLLGDVSFFRDAGLGDGWNWDDESYWYAAQTSALAFHENVAEVRVSADRVGAPLGVMLGPAPGFLRVENEAVAGGEGAAFTALRRRGVNVLELSGRLQAGKTQRFTVSVETPALWFLHNLRHVLADAGVTVAGDNRIVRASGAEGVVLATHVSPPLRDLAAHTNRESHNLYAEHLLKTIGAQMRNRGDWAAGVKAVEAWAASLGVSAPELQMADGSGLSRKNLISPRAMGALLAAMRQRPHFSAFYASLPVAGVHGSLRSRMKGGPAEGVVRAKVGYVTHNIALAGYAEDRRGRRYVFVTFVNNHAGKVRDAKALQDAVANRLCAIP